MLKISCASHRVVVVSSFNAPVKEPSFNASGTHCRKASRALSIHINLTRLNLRMYTLDYLRVANNIEQYVSVDV